MITTIDGEGNKTYHWKCQYCDFKLLSKQFSAAKARIHLTGDVHLRSGLINQVCTSSPTEVMCQMSAMIAAKRDRRTLKAAFGPGAWTSASPPLGPRKMGLRDFY